MKDKLMVVKDKLIIAKDGAKRFFAKSVAVFKRCFFYVRNMMKFAVPFLLVICVLLVMYTHSQDRRHELELKEAAEQSYVISEYFVAEELKTIGELNTAEYTYTIERSHSDYRKVFNCNVPLTEKSLSVLYSGEVEVGYNIADMKYTTVGNVILFSIPEPIVENHINKEVVKDEENNIFNPINADDYAKLREGVLDEGLNKAVAKGTYATAETELKSILTTHFEKLGCTVKFV